MDAAIIIIINVNFNYVIDVKIIDAAIILVLINIAE